MGFKRFNYYKAAPEMMKAMMALEDSFKKTVLPHALCELVRIRASQINGCAYCIDMHVKNALQAGEDERRLFTLSAWKETNFFNEREKAALLWTETLTLVSEKQVPDEIYDKVSACFTQQELAELTFIIGTINSWNRLGIAFAGYPA